MHGCLRLNPQSNHQRMRIGIPGKQSELEEQQAGRPDGGPAAEPWKDVFANQRLNLKEEERAEEDGEGEHESGHAKGRRSEEIPVNSSLISREILSRGQEISHEGHEGTRINPIEELEL
jgi:hypothetical protein